MISRIFVLGIAVMGVFGGNGSARGEGAVRDSSWSFTLVEPGVKQRVASGSATKASKDHSISGSMSSALGLVFRLSGTLKGERLEAKLEFVDSDVPELPCSGTFMKRALPANMGGGTLESIVCTDGLSVLVVGRVDATARVGVELRN